MKVLQAADRQGLSPQDYLPEPAADSLALTRSLLRYVHDVQVGRLTPRALPALWCVQPAPYDPTPELAKALAEGRLQALIDAQPPRATPAITRCARAWPAIAISRPGAVGKPCRQGRA